MTLTPLTFAGITLAGLICQWLAWKLKLPAILFLLLCGIFLGPLLGLVSPDQLLGDLLFPVVSLSVALVLIEGSLTLSFNQIRDQRAVVRRMVTIGAVITGIVTAIAVEFLFHLGWPMSALMASMVVVTGPTVVIPMLRTIQPTAPIANVLRWEGILIDPVGALLAILVYQFLLASSLSSAFGQAALAFAELVGFGSLLGCGAGWLLGIALRRHWVPEYLHNLATISFVLTTFTVANFFAHESGLLAVTIMGVWLANMPGVHVEKILSFKENLSVLLISALFILLAARIDIQQLFSLGWPALMLLFVVQFLARPLAVLFSCLNSDLRWQERLLIAWIGPKGIVAAAVSALFALRLEQAGIPEAQILVPITFFIIIGTVVVQSATARPLAFLLGVAEDSARGCLIVGANPVARELAKVLKANQFPTLLVDENWDNVAAARMEGLEAFYGNAISEHADQNLDLIGIGRLFALTPRSELNTLACLRYRPEFGRDDTFSIQATSSKPRQKRHVVDAHRGVMLFDEGLTFAKLSSLLKQNAKLKTTSLTGEFSFAELVKQGNGQFHPLFAISPQKQLYAFSIDKRPEPGPGWKVIGLQQAPAQSAGASQDSNPNAVTSPA